MSRRWISALLVAACLCMLGAVGVSQAAVLGHGAATHKATHKHKAPPKKAHGLVAPSLLTPANGANVQQVPALTWSAVSGAVEYEYQLAANAGFDSIVIGSGIGLGTSTTYNQAAALSRPLTDGTYYWRVRALTKTKEPGPWSATRTLLKGWTQQPQLLEPAEGEQITWPTKPLILGWSAVDSATEYIVTIASDRELSNIVLGSATSPQKTSGTVYALPGTLPAGQYYWAITPIDVEGHRGARSAIKTFNWSWPTQTTTSVTPLNSEPGEATLKWTPEFTWNPVPGAAHYEVEVNTAEGFPPGSTWFKGIELGTTASPLLALNNAEYYWRVRAIDSNGNAGVWNEGPRFKKAFDNETPTIHNLKTVDVNGNATPPDPTTGSPIVTWSPVPGAASYEVEIEPWNPSKNEYCGKYEAIDTPSPAFTPIANGEHVGQQNWPSPRGGSVRLEPGVSYCVQVAARSDVDAFGYQIESARTAVNGGGLTFKYEPRITRCTHAFEDERTAREDEKKALQAETEGKTAEALELNEKASAAKGAYETIYKTYEYLSKPLCERETGETTEVSTYLLPKYGTTETRTPLFTWEPVPSAECYYVAIARDPLFTNVVDVSKVYGTAYAPAIEGEEPLDDQTTTYYWTVFPVAPGTPFHACEGGVVGASHYSIFNKSSVPPTALSPVGGAEVSTQPTFKWTPAEGALNYTIEVSQNETFGKENLLDEVKTDSTAYTSATTYPANVTLYWRVRADDANTTNTSAGLHWSAVQTFKRTLPVPQPRPSTTEGQGLPVRSWTPVTGATAYQLHVELPNGTTKDFTVDSTAFTPTELFGNGIWHWQVSAEFPKGTYGTVAGGYFAPQPFVHELAAPQGVVGEKSGSRIVVTWNPDQYAKEYEVQIATTDTFSPTIESRKVDEASWAPNVDLTVPANRGTLYWRVAALDPQGNIGSYASGKFVPPRPKPKCVVKKIKRKGKTVKVCVVVKPKPKPKPKKHH
jgi:hypothetical protein